MSDRVVSLALTGFLLVVVSAATWMAVDFGAEARRVPLAVGIPTGLFLAIQLVRELLGLKLGPEISDAKEAEESKEAEEPKEAEASGGSGAVASEVGSPAAGDDVAGGEDADSSVTTEAAGAEEATPKASALQAFAWILALGFSFWLFGMLATVPIFMGAFMRIYGRESWKTIAIIVGSTVLIMHLFFVVLLEVQLYPGVLGDWLDL
jgi:hypothetical protein